MAPPPDKRTCPIIRQPKQEQLNPLLVNSLHQVFIARRKGLVEHPFGTIKRGMNQGYFRPRGLPKVRTEMSLTVLVYNLKRAINTRSVGVPPLIQALPSKQLSTSPHTPRSRSGELK